MINHGKLCIHLISINSYVFGEKYLRDTWSRFAVYRLKMTVLIIGWSWKFTFLMTCSFDDEILPSFSVWSSCVWKGSEMPRERDVTRVLCIEWFNNGLSSIRESIILEGLIADVQWLLDFLYALGTSVSSVEELASPIWYDIYPYIYLSELKK